MPSLLNSTSDPIYLSSLIVLTSQKLSLAAAEPSTGCLLYFYSVRMIWAQDFGDDHTTDS